MRSRRDARIESQPKTRAKKRTKKASAPNGGKALRRLFNYLSERDRTLNTDVMRTLVIPQAIVSQFMLPKGMTPARAAKTLAERPRKTRAAPAAQPFASAMVKAAASLQRAPARRTRRRKTGARAAAAAAPGGGAGPAGGGTWQAIGPDHVPNGQTYGSNRVDVIGRVASIAIDPRSKWHILLGSAGGGIWESKDDGATWQPRTDQMPSLAIGAVTFDPRNPKRVYAGSGEGNFYANLGAGVYLSKDGGTTWDVLAKAPFIGVGFYRLVVDPRTPATLYAATTNGFYRSTNAGSSWTRRRAGRCWDLSVHPGGGAVEVLAAFEDGVFRSTNSGTSFSAVTLPTTPPAPWTRLAVDRTTSSPDVAYVFGAAGNAAHLWRRSGTTWRKYSVPASLSVNQAWYDWYVAASPDNPRLVYVGAIDTLRGTLSGTVFRWVNITTQGNKSIHPDQHCLSFAPGNSRTIYAGNDGGIYRSTNSGGSWKELNKGLAITEIEYMASDPATWKWLLAGTQDNGTLRYTGSSKWDHVADGDGGDCGVDQNNPNTVYHSYYNVSLERSDNKGDTWTWLAPPAIPSLFYPPVEVAGLTVAIGATALLVTRNGSAPWDTVALGLVAGEVSTAMRAIDANTLLVGTNGGRILRLNWIGTTWNRTNLTSPVAKYISCIAVDPSNPLRIWITSTQVTGAGGRVYRSDDGGGSWVDCTAGLPAIPINAVVVDPGNFKQVWVAADMGVYQSQDLGATWAAFANGLPNAMAADLLFHRQDRKLICGTRNRGAWVIDVP
jgi:photosystem II stability/assembly factor-like uncharacterized protein